MVSPKNNLTIELPVEFVELCRSYNMQPGEDIRQFVADAACIMNLASNPRPDGYSSSGSDERTLAMEYMHRAFGARITE